MQAQSTYSACQPQLSDFPQGCRPVQDAQAKNTLLDNQVSKLKVFLSNTKQSAEDATRRSFRAEAEVGVTCMKNSKTNMPLLLQHLLATIHGYWPLSIIQLCAADLNNRPWLSAKTGSPSWISSLTSVLYRKLASSAV